MSAGARVNPALDATGEAIRQIKSAIGKCEKARTILKEGSASRQWVDRQLSAYYLAVALLSGQSGETVPKPERSVADLSRARETFELLTHKCAALLPKFPDGSPQKTLAVRRLAAFRLASEHIEEEIAGEADQSVNGNGRSDESDTE